MDKRTRLVRVFAFLDQPEGGRVDQPMSQFVRYPGSRLLHCVEDGRIAYVVWLA